jgi:NADPH-dependent curcumin reductase CurA
MPTNHQIHLDNRPVGEAVASNFKLVTTETPALQDGQVLVRHHFLSLDPYMRGRMNDAKSYAQPQALGQTMGGGTVGEIAESRNPKFAVGDKVVGMGGWQEYSVVDATQPGALRKVDTTHVPLSAYLGAVGMPGVTAWYGLVKICEPKAGQTMVVSAATGAVGSAFAALSKARGCRTVGIAGGPDKCKYAVDELGFDACIDYKLHDNAASLSKAIAAACPNGIDGYFENVGGMVLDAVLAAHERLWPHRRLRHDCRLRRRAAAAELPGADPDPAAEGAGLYRQRTHGSLARSIDRAGHAGGHRQAARPREHCARSCCRARSLPGPAQGQKLWQAVG